MRATAPLLVLPLALLCSPALADEDPRSAPAADDDGEGWLPEGWEGPLPADRDHGLEDDDARGLWFGAAAQAAYFDRDPWASVILRGGIEHRYVTLRARLPLDVRVWDLPPSTGSGSWPLQVGGGVRTDGCRWLRCAQLQRRPNELGVSMLAPSLPARLEPLRLLTLVDELTLGRPSDPVHFRLAPMRQTLGDGTLIDGVLSQPLAGIPRPGARAGFSLLAGTFEGEAMVADAARPWELSGGQLVAHPLALLTSEMPWLDRLVRRLEIGAQMATDLTAPAVPAALDAAGDVVDWRLTRPVLAGSMHAAADLTTPGALLSFRPHTAMSAFYGLSIDGLGAPAFGGAWEAGLRASASLPFVGLSLSATGGVDSPGARTGLFSTLYLLERRRALAGGVLPGGGALTVPATGGVHARGSLELVVVDVVRAGLRGQLGSAPGTDAVELFVDVAAFGARASWHVLKRLAARPNALRLPTTTEALALAAPDTSWWSVAEIAVPVWGPFAVYGRWLHAPRLVPTVVPTRYGLVPSGAASKPLRADDDVTFGVSADVALDSPLLDLL
jgi:hypothetical protein